MTGTPGPDGEDDYERDDPEDEHGHEQPPFCRRNIIDLDTTDGSRVIIDHLFPAAGDTPRCPSCDGLCIAPGLVATAMTEKLNEKQREAILARIPAAKLGTPEDVAAAAVFLASNEAAYVNGQTIHVNGGMAMI